jgi:hypothetical protein
MDPSFDVHVQGAVSQSFSSASNVLGTLPGLTLTGILPNHVVYTIAHTFNGTYADVAINPNGQIALIDSRPPAIKDYSFVSLEGITYGHGTSIAINSLP